MSLTKAQPEGFRASPVKAVAHVSLGVAVVSWASTFISVKIVLPQVPPNTLAFLRFLIVSVVFGAYCLLSKNPLVRREDWPRAAACGLTGITLYNFLQNQGLRYAGATDAAILASMAPVFMALLGYFVLREKISPIRVLGIVIAFAGSVLVATKGSLEAFTANPLRLWGDFLVLLTGLAWAVYNVVLKGLLQKYPPFTILTSSTLAGTLFLFPLMIAETPDLSAVTATAWLHVLYLSLFGSAAAYLLWNSAVERVSTVTAGAYLYLIPIAAAVIAALVLKEIPGVYLVIGGITVLAGTYFAAWK